ncbi:hypothetical protein D3C85_1420300 [compost metagenome]
MESVERFTGQPAGSNRRAALNGIVTLLNQLPAWIEAPRMNTPARQELLRDMVLSALRGALRATQECTAQVDTSIGFGDAL